MDVGAHCNDFTLLRNDRFGDPLTRRTYTAQHTDESRKEQLSQEEDNVLVLLECEWHGSARVT